MDATVEVRGIIIRLADEAIEALLPLTPGCCSRDPIRDWTNQSRARVQLWAVGMLDERGNLTEFGIEVWEAVQASWEHEGRAVADRLEMEELDELDRRCRRRPRPRRYDG